MLCSKSFLLRLIKVMTLHADGEERTLDCLFRLVLVVSCIRPWTQPSSGPSSQAQTNLSHTFLFVKVPRNSAFYHQPLCSWGSSPAEVRCKGHLSFLPPFCLKNDKYPSPLCPKPFTTNPELWPSVSILECMTQQTPGWLALSLLNDSLTNSSLIACEVEICASAKSHISTCQSSLGLLVNGRWC